MMNNNAIRFAASTLVIGLTMVGCKPAGSALRPAAVSDKAVAKADKKAADFYRQAEAALGKRDFDAAIGHVEEAVALSPRDVGYRMLLADLYLKQGRFSAAETTFKDVIELNPGNARAALNLALVQVGLGKSGAAIAQLDSVAATAAPGDVGLAYALAGQPQRAVEMLEPAARADAADARVRQNLALAYALAGDWQKARATAGQDLSPALIDSRMEEWAAFVQPAAPYSQVASLLGVTPVEDAGQPVRLALAPQVTEGIALAEADVPSLDELPSEIARAFAAAGEVVPTDVAMIEPELQETYASAVDSLVEARPDVVLASAAHVEAPIPTFRPAEADFSVKPKGGRFVVQLGAFRSPMQVEKAWAQVHRRFASVSDGTPVSTTVRINGKGVFHRLAVSGFPTHSDASRVCSSVKSKGGVCFVRVVAGDAPVRWASRYTKRG